jgi:hypothetical protein
MKRKLRIKSLLKQTLLAVPAAALMLGAAQAGTTIGLNFNSFYYNTDGANWATAGGTPGPAGFGWGYQTSGWPVTAKAFGVPAANWFNGRIFAWWTATPVDVNVPMGSVGAQCTSPAAIETGIGEQVDGWNPETVAPGNDEVTWNILQSNSGVSPSVLVTNLAATFPNGYVVETITAARGSDKTFNGVGFTDTITTTHADYNTTYYRQNPASDGSITGGTIGLSDPSGTFTGDTLQINCDFETAPSSSVLCGFIITDKPVITYSYPPNTLAGAGGAFVLSASVIGIDTLSYQWQHAGTNIPGATFVNYTNSSAKAADAGNYQLIVTGSRFPSSPATGDVLVVSVIPTHAAQTATWDANTTTTGAQDGSGTWSYTLTNWWNGSVDDYWGAPDSAVFGMGGAGPFTVTLSDNIIANAITFNSSGYTLTNASGKSLALQGSAVITAGAAATATIGAPLSTGTNTLLKAGTGALILSGAMQSTQTVVSAGSLEVLAKIVDSPYVVTNNATLKIGYSPGGGYANTAMQIYGDGTAATTGFYIKGGQNYNCSGQIQLLNAPTTIRQYGTGLAGIGMFDINHDGIWCTAAASGSVTDTNIQMVSRGYGMSAHIDAGANTATGDLIINGPLNIPPSSDAPYGFVKRGTGSLRLNAAALAANSGLRILAGSVICGVNNCLGANCVLQVPAAGTLDFNGTRQTVSNATLAGTLKMTINKGGTPNSTVLTVADAVTYGGNLIVTNIGGALVMGDTFTLFNNLSGTGYGGMFDSLSLPPLADRQGWQDNTAVDGTIKVAVGSVPPTITTDLPADPSYAYVGGSFRLFVVASGDPLLHYLWKRGTTTVGTDSPTLTLTSVTTADTGDYSVTVSNPWGSAPSGTTHVEVLSPSGYPGIAMAGGPAGYWPLNEVSGTTVWDYAGSHNGSYLNFVTLGVPGAIPGSTGTGTAITASTGGNYASVPYTPALNPAGPFTVVAWFNPSGPADAGLFVCPLSSADMSSSRKGWLIYQSPTGWNFRTYLNNGATAGVNITGSAAPVIGAWTQVICVWDGTKGYLYENGVLTATSGATTFVPNSTAPFTIGARSDGAYYLNGNSTDDVSIDEVQFYNRALSSQEIQALGLNRPILKLAASGSTVVLTWPAGTLQAAPEATGTYTNVPSATSPWPVTPARARTFYRLMP